MGRLIHPGVGEVVDRLSILALKIEHGDRTERPTEHFKEEAAVLRARLLPIPPRVTCAFLTLSGINREIWSLEDRIRQWRAWVAEAPETHLLEMPALQATAFRLQELNDRRATIIADLNLKSGDRWQEKQHDLR